MTNKVGEVLGATAGGVVEVKDPTRRHDLKACRGVLQITVARAGFGERIERQGPGNDASTIRLLSLRQSLECIGGVD
jgi:hypothetical protein